MSPSKKESQQSFPGTPKTSDKCIQTVPDSEETTFGSAPQDTDSEECRLLTYHVPESREDMLNRRL